MNIYVGNLSLEMTEDELRKEFAEFGKVISVTIMNDRHTGSDQRRGYGYVEMATKPEGDIAIANLEGKKLRNRVVNLVEALPLSVKRRTATPDITNGNRSNRRRDRRYLGHLSQLTPHLAVDSYALPPSTSHSV